MAQKTRFLIAPLTGGLQTDVRPWLIPDDAYASLKNMYVFRGRTRKRVGSELLTDPTDPLDVSVAQLGSRFRIQVDTVDGGGSASGVVPTDRQGNIIAAIGQMFSIGTNMYTAYQAAGDMLTTGGASTYTFDTATGAFVFTGAAAAEPVYWYPSLPVMGLIQRETAAINDEPTIGFDTVFAYQYINGGWTNAGTLGALVSSWSGSDAQFFWGSSWRGNDAATNLFFVSNFNFDNGPGSGFAGGDPLRYFNGSTWTYYAPLVNATDNRRIFTARIVVPFKDRLIMLNVVENTGSDFPTDPVTVNGTNQQFGNRCRFSQNGSPLDTNAFLETEVGRGGFIDAPTQEHIVSAEFLKDRLIVFFERSTWELVYTGNQIIPFVWQQINTELGAESTFSIVPFDKVVLGIGDTGVHSCNGANVERIDQKIPDFVFEIHNDNDGPKRVYGIRDYNSELVYWSVPEDDDTYPTKILLYNYANSTWALFDDSITAFGVYQYQDDRTWASQGETTWEEAEFTWGSAIYQSKFRSVLAGNQQGWTFVMNRDISRNSPALQITNITKDTPSTGFIRLDVINHNLQANSFVSIENIQGITGPFLPIYEVYSVQSEDIIDIYAPDIAGAAGDYTGGGTIARVSRPEALTKQFNFFAKDGRNLTCTEIDFMVDKTVDGELSVDYYTSSSNLSLGQITLDTKPYDPTYYPLEQSQSRLWHRIYIDADGETVQLKLSLNDTQMLDSSIAWSDIEIHAIMFQAYPSSQRFQ